MKISSLEIHRDHHILYKIGLGRTGANCSFDYHSIRDSNFKGHIFEKKHKMSLKRGHLK